MIRARALELSYRLQRGNAEPLLRGDRQIAKRVAKERNPLQRLCFEVSLS
jgi:hypothetical protein